MFARSGQRCWASQSCTKATVMGGTHWVRRGLQVSDASRDSVTTLPVASQAFPCPRRALQGHTVHHLGAHHPEYLRAQRGSLDEGPPGPGGADLCHQLLLREHTGGVQEPGQFQARWVCTISDTMLATSPLIQAASSLPGMLHRGGMICLGTLPSCLLAPGVWGSEHGPAQAGAGGRGGSAGRAGGRGC